jgi:hypothetical protein
MAIYSDRYTDLEHEAVEEWERDTGFEMMRQEDFDAGQITFAEMCRSNVTWLTDWAQECVSALERSEAYKASRDAELDDELGLTTAPDAGATEGTTNVG